MPRAGLSRAAVVDLALAVVDDGGLRGFENLTLAAVAGRARVAVPSLYKHVRGLPELRRAVALVSVRGLTAVIEASGVGSDGPEALRATADVVRGYARSFPGRYAAAQGGQWLRDPDATGVRVAAAQTVAAVASVLELFELPPKDVIDAVRMVRAALHGFVTIELDGGFGLPQDVDQSFNYLLDALVAALNSR